MTATQPIGDIAITSRPFDDYLAQFALTKNDLLAGPLLDCPGGASDFAAEVRALGGRVHSVDPRYALSIPDLRQIITSEFARVLDWTASQPDRFPLNDQGVWEHAPMWQASARTFLADFERDRNDNSGHYQAHALPTLPFPDDSFMLAVSGFLLFTYPGKLDLDFHLKAIQSLLRVAGEVRLHPLNDSAGNPYAALPTLLEHLTASGINADLLTVPGRSDTRDTLTLRLVRD